MGPLGRGIEGRRGLLDYAPAGITFRPERAQQRRTLDSQPYPRDVDLQPVWRRVAELLLTDHEGGFAYLSMREELSVATRAVRRLPAAAHHRGHFRGHYTIVYI
jgi:hypothetical protein